MADPDFDLAYHLRHVRIPHPGGFAELMTLAELSEMAPLDPARPLWEITLVEGKRVSARAATLPVAPTTIVTASAIQAWRLTEANPRFLLVHGIPPAPPAPPSYRPGTRRQVERVVAERRRTTA